MKKLLFENLSLKIVAFLLSIVLWIFVTSRGQSEISMDVPIEFKNIPPGFEIVNQNIKRVSLNIKGHERLINNLKPTDIKVYIDLSKSKKGKNILYITRDDIRTPSGMRVSSINPSSVEVVMEETKRKVVKVIPIITGEIPKGFYVKSINVSPDSIEIEGRKTEINKIRYIRTEPLDISGINETFTQTLKIDFAGRNIRANVTDVKVRVEIEERKK